MHFSRLLNRKWTQAKTKKHNYTITLRDGQIPMVKFKKILNESNDSYFKWSIIKTKFYKNDNPKTKMIIADYFLGGIAEIKVEPNPAFRRSSKLIFGNSWVIQWLNSSVGYNLKSKLDWNQISESWVSSSKNWNVCFWSFRRKQFDQQVCWKIIWTMDWSNLNSEEMGCYHQISWRNWLALGNCNNKSAGGTNQELPETTAQNERLFLIIFDTWSNSRD